MGGIFMSQQQIAAQRSLKRRNQFRRNLPLYVMLLLPVLLLFIYNYIPMAGIVIAFQKFLPAKGVLGSKWVGLQNFKTLFGMPGFGRALCNTLTLSVWKIVLGVVVPVAFTLLLNELGSSGFKRTVQTMIYLPHFISWSVAGGLVYMLEGFSFLKLGVAVMGGYFLLDHLGVFSVDLGDLVFPILLVILALALLGDALKKKQKRGKWQVYGKNKQKHNFTCSEREGSFRAENSFGEQTFLVTIDKLNRGWAEVSFGESVVDLTGVDSVGEKCRLEADVSFGEMTIRCPRRFRMACNNSGSFGGMEYHGNPDEEPQGVIALDGSTSFGSLVIEYI